MFVHVVRIFCMADLLSVFDRYQASKIIYIYIYIYIHIHVLILVNDAVNMRTNSQVNEFISYSCT